MPVLRPCDVTFLQLRDSVFCVECELISYNNGTKCLACGSAAVMNLSRILGGSLRSQQTANIVDDEMLSKVVDNTLECIRLVPTEIAEVTAARNRTPEEPAVSKGFFGLPQFNPASAMRFVVDRAFTFTRAHGAALALWKGDRMVCQAHSGAAVPNIGSEVHTQSGLSGLCVRTGQTWRCDDAANDPNVNVEACRELGIRSVIAAPLNHLNKVLGILQVLSSEAFAFDDRDVATVQFLSQLMVMAFARRSNRRAEASLDTGMNMALAR